MDYDPRYLAGVLLFNDTDFFEAHELWEDLWSESHGDARRFFQGLIQAAVGLCHFANGNLRGAIKLYHSSRDYMSPCPSPFLGLDLDEFWQQMERCFAPALQTTSPVAPALEQMSLPRITLTPAPAVWPNPADYRHADD
jgi:predicted metal-dependent hydrolase